MIQGEVDGVPNVRPIDNLPCFTCECGGHSVRAGACSIGALIT